mmetsp:Transcript_23262/g.88140  ORF Transcript_23262/g.88140 Transcript_23262/m.88140 type:complete len:360 (+) Transcript_23262:950-2029(+)
MGRSDEASVTTSRPPRPRALRGADARCWARAAPGAACWAAPRADLAWLPPEVHSSSELCRPESCLPSADASDDVSELSRERLRCRRRAGTAAAALAETPGPASQPPAAKPGRAACAAASDGATYRIGGDDGNRPRVAGTQLARPVASRASMSSSGTTLSRLKSAPLSRTAALYTSAASTSVLNRPRKQYCGDRAADASARGRRRCTRKPARPLPSGKTPRKRDLAARFFASVDPRNAVGSVNPPSRVQWWRIRSHVVASNPACSSLIRAASLACVSSSDGVCGVPFKASGSTGAPRSSSDTLWRPEPGVAPCDSARASLAGLPEAAGVAAGTLREAAPGPPCRASASSAWALWCALGAR